MKSCPSEDGLFSPFQHDAHVMLTHTQVVVYNRVTV